MVIHCGQKLYIQIQLEGDTATGRVMCFNPMEMAMGAPAMRNEVMIEHYDSDDLSNYHPAFTYGDHKLLPISEKSESRNF